MVKLNFKKLLPFIIIAIILLAIALLVKFSPEIREVFSEMSRYGMR